MEVMEGRDFCWMKAMEGYDCGFIIKWGVCGEGRGEGFNWKEEGLMVEK